VPELFPAATPSWKLAPRLRSKHEKRTAGSTWETLTVAAADGVRFTRVRWEIDLLLTFKTAPFFCEYPVYVVRRQRVKIYFLWYSLKQFLSFLMHSPTSHVSQNHFVRWGSFLVLHWAHLRELPLFGMWQVLSYLSPGATYGLNLLSKLGDFFALVGVFVFAPIRPATNDNLNFIRFVFMSFVCSL
jgi:hypothetical protein